MKRSPRRRSGVQEPIHSSDTPSNWSTSERPQSLHHPAAPSVSSFQNAQVGGEVNIGRVYTVGGDLIVNDDDLVTTILLPHVASGAMFDSAERYPAGKCHPGTRQRMIDRVKEWIQGTSPDSKGILWMYGPAGAGKSSLMQSICEFLKDSDPETNGASFFFARGPTDRGNATKLFVTLAHQLVVRFPSLRSEINKALYADATLPTKSMDIQLRSLIIEPLLRCKGFPKFPSLTPILFIDGLDECGVDHAQGVDTQCQIITLISRCLVDYKIPVRFMIASRPEYWIRDVFDSSPLSDITLCLSLRDDLDADTDIRKYLVENFEQIRLKKSRIMRSVALPWPAEHVVNRLVEEASGQYIYASTVLKFVGDHPFKNPEEQLRIISTPGPHRAIAYSELDRLYATIVSAYPEWETMKLVLGGLLIRVNLIVIRVIFGVSQTELTLVLDALRSLIDVVPPEPLSEDDQLLIPIFGPSFEDEKISFCHLSFREFLIDEARSGLYHIDIVAVLSEVIIAFFVIIRNNVEENYKSEPHTFYHLSLLEYRRMMDAIIGTVDLRESYFYDFEDIFMLLQLEGMMETFRCFDPGQSMNHPECFMRDMDSLSTFLRKLHPIFRFNKEYFSSMDPPPNPNAVEQDLLEDSLMTIVDQLQQLSSMARKVGIRLLSLRDGFSITQNLFLIWYLQPSSRTGVKFEDLLKIPGSTVDDKLSSILRHCHIIDVECFRDKHIWTPADPSIKQSLYMSVVNLGQISVLDEPGMYGSRLYWLRWTNYGAVVDLGQEIGKGWLCHTEWINQHIFLVWEILTSITNNLYSDWEYLSISQKHGDKFLNVQDSILIGFFNDGGISDMHGEDYFANKYNLSFLEVMVDLKTWSALFPSRRFFGRKLESVIAPVLRWFNRQLTNPKTVKLIEDHDASLLSKMTTAMHTIFHKCFVPLFTTPYFSRLIISTWTFDKGHESFEIEVSSSSYSTKKIVPCRSPTEYNRVDVVRNLHNEIFRKRPQAGGNRSVIPRSEWHPYFAAYLLNICVKFLHFQTESAVSGDSHSLEFGAFFDCIVQCLPYAHATPQNLDALRAIKHLSEQVNVQSLIPRSWPLRGFYPPSGFCSGAREFLKRYKPSILSSEELFNFELWMGSIEEVSLKDWDQFVRTGIKISNKQ